jgi:uncharacterized protein (DUF302 family)
MAGRDLRRLRSAHGFAETLARLERAIGARGLTVFARFDHAANASGAGLSLRPTTVIVFGNATAGTPLMQLDQDVGIELPLRMLVTEDEAGAVHLTHADPRGLLARYELGDAGQRVVTAMAGLLDALATTAAG